MRETAIANAKLQLEESIAPTIKAELTKALSQTEEVAETVEVAEAHDPKGAEANDFAEVGESVESADVADEDSEVEIVSEDESATDDVVEGESSVNEEAEETEEQVDEVDITVRGATTTISGPDINAAPELKEEEEDEEEEEVEDVMDDEEDDEDMEDLDLEAIIRELQAEVDALSEDDEEDEEDEVPAVEDEEDEEEVDVDVDEGDEEEVEVEDEEDEDEEEVEEDLDLDAILREIEAELSEEDETELAQENTRLQDELSEYRKAVELLRGKLNEVNLLNAKLLYTNKLFRGKELSQDQKIHVVETFDLATTIREVKLLYATLGEATVNVPNRKKQTTSSTEVVAEGIASKVVGGTAPTTEVLQEDQFAGFRKRMKELAGINVL